MMSLEYYTDGEIWVAHGDGWRTGVRCWHECQDAHVEIVYQEYVDGSWIEKSSIGPVDKAMWERLVKYGTFLIEVMEEK